MSTASIDVTDFTTQDTNLSQRCMLFFFLVFLFFYSTNYYLKRLRVQDGNRTMRRRGNMGGKESGDEATPHRPRDVAGDSWVIGMFSSCFSSLLFLIFRYNFFFFRPFIRRSSHSFSTSGIHF